MTVSIDISLYPLTADYEPPIIEFIKRLRSAGDYRIATNQLTTQLSGDYDQIMRGLTEAMRPTLASDTPCSFVVKILNVETTPNQPATL